MPFIADNSPTPKLKKILVKKHKKIPQSYVVVIAPIEFSLTRAYPSAAYAAFSSLLIIISNFDRKDADTHIPISDPVDAGVIFHQILKDWHFLCCLYGNLFILLLTRNPRLKSPGTPNIAYKNTLERFHFGRCDYSQLHPIVPVE